MKEYHLTKVIPIKLLLLISFHSYIISLPCQKYSFCFECLSNATCTWDFNSCHVPSFPLYINNNNKLPKKCFEQKDNRTKDFLQTYCGDLFYYFSENDKSLSISLPIHNQTLYGIENLYCEYTIYNKDSIDSFTIQTTKNWGNLKIQAKLFYSTTIKEIILGNGDKNIINNAEELKIIFESDSQKNLKPFEIKIVDTFSPFNKIIIAGIILFSFILVLIIIILLIIWCKRRKRMAMNNNIFGLNNIYINNINIINDISTDRIGLKNYLKMIKAVKFQEVEKNIKDIKNKKCLIDLENFEPDADVILTECFHVFHYECLKTFIEKNHKLKELKCPLCNHVLYSTQIRLDNNINNQINDQK